MKKTTIITSLVVLSLILAACNPGKDHATAKRTIGGKQAPKQGQISKLELRDELDRFKFLFISQMKQTADDISAADGTRRTRRTNTQMKTRTMEALHAMTTSDDPVIAFLDTWALLMRLELYYKGGPGSSIHGEQQHLAIEFIDKALEYFERIGYLFLEDEQFEELKRGVFRFAVKNPIDGRYSNLVVFATQEREEEVGVLMRTLSIPMAPIRAMEGVDNTATAIHRVRDSIERFNDVAEQMPESTRWQMSILMDDFEESEMTQSFLNNLDDFSQSSTQLVQVMETMPEQMRTELLTVLEESDESQQQLQTTMQTAAEAADRVEQMFAQLSTTSQTLNVTAQQANNAAIAWKAASDSIQDLVGMFKGKPRDPNAPPGFGMRDFDNMLLNAGQTADKVGNAVMQIQDTASLATLKEMQKQIRSLIDHVMWRLFELVLAVVILVSGARYVIKKLRKVPSIDNQ